MSFEWDAAKRDYNFAKHRVDFVDMFPLFDGELLERVDDRFDYGETRVGCLGEVDGRIYFVVYTWRGTNRRLISARRANAERERNIVRVTAEEARRMKGHTDYAALDAMTDEDIARAVAEDPDAGPLDIDWSQARLVLPPGKDNVTLRVDRDVLAWFRSTGKGFHTRMNAVLRAYMEAHRHSSR